MGKGLAFLNLKFFHPSNKENQQRKWEAIQKDNQRAKKEKERMLELKQEKDLQNTRLMISKQLKGDESEEYRLEVERSKVAWMYNEPPGLKKSLENERKKN